MLGILAEAVRLSSPGRGAWERCWFTKSSLISGQSTCSLHAKLFRLPRSSA
jgi:hypothetical protein